MPSSSGWSTSSGVRSGRVCSSVVTGGLAAGDAAERGRCCGPAGRLLLPADHSILALGLTFVLYAALARYAATNSHERGSKFNEVIASVRTNFSPWLMLWLVSLLAGFVGGLGLIACGIGVLFTGF